MSNPKDAVQTDAIRAVAVLRKAVVKGEVPEDVAAAIGILFDHVTWLEQFAQLVLSGVRSAEKNKPKSIMIRED